MVGIAYIILNHVCLLIIIVISDIYSTVTITIRFILPYIRSGEVLGDNDLSGKPVLVPLILLTSLMSCRLACT